MKPTKFMSGLRLFSVVALFAGIEICEAAAATPDGIPPSREEVCDDLEGAAFGLCNAFCEAQDCDVYWKSSCDSLRGNFFRITGSSLFPCESGDATRTPTSTAIAAQTTATHTRTATRTPEPAQATATRTKTKTPTRTPESGSGATHTRTATRTPEGGMGAATATRTQQRTATKTRTPYSNEPTATRTKDAEDDVCDHLHGAAFGLCTAFCHAHNCPAVPNPSCEVLRGNFERQTGSAVFPCEADPGVPTSTPSPSHCMCDCGGDGTVSIGDLTLGVRILLGTMPIANCPPLAVRSDQLTVHDLVIAVRQALAGC